MSSDIQYSTSRVSFNKSKINLNNFAKEFVITSKDDGYKEKMNFCNIETKTNFYIEKGNIKEFFDRIEKCRIEGVNLNFTEYQKKGCLENKIGSGVFLDFDLYFTNKKKLNISFQDLILEILNEFKNVLDFGLNDFNEFDEIDEISGMFAYKQFYIAYAIVLGKKEPEYDQKSDTYKNGFHILFPNILLTRSVKKYLLVRLSENKIIKKIIMATGTTTTENYLDKNSSNVPHVLFGSSKVGKIPYCLIDAYKTYIKKKVIDIPHPVIEVLNSKTINTDRGQIKLNLIKEFNLNYPGDLIRFKQYIPPKKSILDKINLRDEQIPDTNSDEVEKYIEDLENEISILSMNIPDIRYIKGMLEILSIKRLSEYDTWRNVIYVLANCGEKYHKLAHWVSSRVHEKYNPSDLDSLWSKAINEPQSKRTLSRKSLFYWAREDNPEDLKKIIENSTFNQINADIFCKISEGNLNHCEFAKYIFIMFREKYVTDKVSPTKIAWYEFVTHDDDCAPGEIYKWKELIFIPKNLNTFISEKLKLIISENIEELENKIKSNDGEDEDAEIELKYYAKLIKNVKKSAQKLSCVNFKTNVFKELQVKFQQDYFTSKLNMDPNIIGVGNGILVLDDLKTFGNVKVPKLIKGFHEYKISKFTPINYEPYNPESNYVKKIEKLINDLFPEDEYDAKEFIMYYLASSLDFHPKESLLLICSGNGSNGKSFLMDFLNNVLGEHYSTKISMDFFTGGRVKSSQADPEAMNLIGKRFAYSSESSPDDKMNVEKVKEYTGHERMSIRGLYRDTITTRLHCNFTIITNFKPIIETTDHGSLRRFLFYEFKYKFVEHDPTNEFEKKMDKKVSNVYKEDKNYQQAFLSIMVKYYIDLHENYDGDIKKVQHPTILKETRNYINTLDHISKFLSIHVVFNESENGTTRSIISLVEKYKSWYEIHIGKFTKPNSYVISSFCNSAIKNKIVKNKKGEDVYFGIRILDSGEELREGDIPIK